MIFSVTILGCNSAIPSTERNQTSQLLNIQEKLFLLDCGEGTQLQLRKYHLKIQRIQHIFISHLHGDHYFGLIGLISTMHLLGRKEELHIYARAELEEIINIQFKYSNSRLAFPLIFHQLQNEKSKIIFENEKLTISSFPLYHSIPTCGFLFREKEKEKNIKKDIVTKLKIPFNVLDKIKKGENFIDEKGNSYKNELLTIEPPAPRSYAYCSDTAYFEPILETIKGVDMLYHEATFMQDKSDAAKEKLHSTTTEAATIAKKAEVKKLLIGHFSARYDDLNPLLHEAKNIFPETFLAEDGQTFSIEYSNK